MPIIGFPDSFVRLRFIGLLFGLPLGLTLTGTETPVSVPPTPVLTDLDWNYFQSNLFELPAKMNL